MANIKILDGGFSAQLSTHVGAKIDGDPLWTARFLSTNREAVYNTHLDFLRAGADIIETNTYQASIPGLMKHLSISHDESVQLLEDAVRLARNAVADYKRETVEGNVTNRNPLVAGSCGPYGAFLHDASEYTGSYSKTVQKEDIICWHRPRIQALVNAGIDLLAIETLPCVEEAEAVIELLKEFPNTKAWLSFSCRRDSQNLADGTNFQQVALRCYKTALPGQILAIGVNCLAPKDVTRLLKGINGEPNKEIIPLIVYPNSGERYTSSEGWIKDNDCPSFESFIPNWLDLGVQYIGGCCRMFAKNIMQIRLEVNKWQEKKNII